MLETVRGPRQLMVGEGVAENVPRVVAECGSRVLIVTDRVLLAQPRVAELIAAVQARVATVAVFADATPDVPLTDVDLAVAAAAQVDADVLLAIGGGTVIDLAKIVGVIHRYGGAPRDYYGESRVPGPTMPLVAVPTTSGTGSELTPVSVLTDPERELKVGVSSVHIVPDFAVVDPELTYSCPATATAYSGIDAFCHAVESYIAAPRAHEPRDLVEQVFLGRNPITDHYALQGAERIARSLRRAVRDGNDVVARADMSYGSVLAGLAFSHAGNGAPHALQYPIGAATHTPHGLGVGLLLPYALVAAREVIGDRLATLSRVCGLEVDGSSESEAADAFVPWLVQLLADIGIPASLADIGVERADLPRFADMASGVTRLIQNHPGPTDTASLTALLEAAWLGDPTAATR
ncbi:iron-containing alcohol dehydrogenase [Nocardioides sp. zg-1228]|uniref:iron-containing alcohol dehydrogenase n=1 Tax=Nocardioides sp. zg-1228 TaxID=2763008 RepID=UPI001642A704|nr:iron-containing alcohol dehydrogenase [Nocardioides sp. zg-1228]MBC2935136.1 iron-containing alcohol dehydrogenase [Nocardioides sp. zg-1228]QSF56992.1 iron-containing alcohol dehydrogenase [Nocardioides sp. zg-1228]